MKYINVDKKLWRASYLAGPVGQICRCAVQANNLIVAYKGVKDLCNYFNETAEDVYDGEYEEV